MRQYQIDTQLLTEDNVRAGAPCLELYAAAEWQQLHGSEEQRAATRQCRADVYTDRLEGVLAIPKKSGHAERYVLWFYVYEKRLVLAGDFDWLAGQIGQLSANKKWTKPGIGKVLAAFLEQCIADDSLYLEEMEDRIAVLEEAVLDGKLEGFNRKMMLFRKELLRYANYYSQMEGVAQELIENENGFFAPDSGRLFRMLFDRYNRLWKMTQALREYSLQICEVYQTQIDISQNRVMKLLTAVTTVVLPLTLITGWYGMNFESMPEVAWEFGYGFVILLSIAVVALCIAWFKRKKFF